MFLPDQWMMKGQTKPGLGDAENIICSSGQHWGPDSNQSLHIEQARVGKMAETQGAFKAHSMSLVEVASEARLEDGQRVV